MDITEYLTREEKQMIRAEMPQEPKRLEGAQEGNQNALKYDTPEKRQALCNAYCLHKSQGYSDAAFTECDMDTLKDYIEKYPDDFPSELIREAKHKNIKFWETIGIHGTVGKLKGFNAKSWEFNMQNRFKETWKLRHDVTSDDKKIESPVLYIPEEKE